MNAQPQHPDLASIKERQQRAWASGDYAMFGAGLLIISELLCEAVDLRPGQKVLDVATGSGNTALAAARRFCEVTGVDYVPALLERGRERAAAERLEVAFREGDAEELPFPDASFDVVLSTVGVMFAPDQKKAAGELLRVCCPGGPRESYEPFGGRDNDRPERLPGGRGLQALRAFRVPERLLTNSSPFRP
jgi:SAM-dependent methyltransferase